MGWAWREDYCAHMFCLVTLKHTGPPALAAAWHVWAAVTAGRVERQRLVRHGIVEVMGVGAAPARLPLAALAADALRRSQDGLGRVRAVVLHVARAGSGAGVG